MWIYYLYLFLAVVLLALQFVMNKLWQSKNGSGIIPSLTYTACSGIATGVLFFLIGGCQLSVTPFSLLMAFGVAVLCLTYSLLGFRIFRLGSFSMFTLFLMLGGMLLPFLYGVFVWNETLSPYRVVGILGLTVSLCFPCIAMRDKSAGDGGGGHRGLLFLLCAVTFVMNGFVSILSKLHSIESIKETVPNVSFVVLTNTINGLLSIAVLIILCFVKHEKPSLPKDFPVSRAILTVLCYSAFGGASYLLQLMAASSVLPASVQYPMITGGSVVLTALAGALFFRERQRGTVLIGTVIAFLSTFLFLF